MHIFFNFSRKESIICILSTIYGGEFIFFGGVSHDTMDKVGTNISVAYSSNLHACGIKALWFSCYHHCKEIFSLLQNYVTNFMCITFSFIQYYRLLNKSSSSSSAPSSSSPPSSRSWLVRYVPNISFSNLLFPSPPHLSTSFKTTYETKQTQKQTYLGTSYTPYSLLPTPYLLPTSIFCFRNFACFLFLLP